jgi:prepilin-type N-terminal cleavage/methylation domain-containing protein
MKRRAFTLVEVLVVIGIVVLIIGIAAPALVAARKGAAKARIQSDLQTIAVALSAYKADFGDIPRIAENQKAPGSSPIVNDLANPNYVYGAELLCWALVGPYEMFGPGGFDPGDGANGPGFRSRRSMGPGPDRVLGTADDVIAGQVYAPYLNAERFRFGRDPVFRRYHALLDYDDKQILYFAKRPGSTVADANNPATGYAGRGHLPMWDLRENEPPFARTLTDAPERLTRFRETLGNKAATGVLGYGEQAIVAEFLLLAAGADNLYGTADDILVFP